MRRGIWDGTSSRAFHNRVCNSFLFLSPSASDNDTGYGVCDDHLFSRRSACEPGGGLLNPGGGHALSSVVTAIVGCLGGSSVTGEYDRAVELK